MKGDPQKTLLGHLAWHLSSKPETVATEGLAYLLASSPEVAEALLREVRGRSALECFKPQPAMAEREIPSGARPDVTILDDSGNNRVFMENKFWAELTDRQPLEYIEGLAADVSSVLLFVVPEPRLAALWKEVKERCASERIELENETCSCGMTAVDLVGEKKSLLMTSWSHVLNLLLEAAEDGGLASVAEDVRQLRGLTDRMALSGFLPLKDEEVGPPFEGRPREEYLSLVSKIVAKLNESERGSTEGLAQGSVHPFKGHFVQVDGFGLFIGVMLESDTPQPPLWCRLHTTEFGGIAKEDLPNLERAFDNRRTTRECELFVPIRLKPDVEENRLVEVCVAQVFEIAERIGQTLGRREMSSPHDPM